jgi:hypothetical protein
LTVSASGARRPKPAVVRTKLDNFRPKSFTEGIREKLLKEFGGDNLSVHRSVSLICATVPAEPTARGHSHFTPCA